MFAKDAPKRRKLAVYVFSKKLLQSTPENITFEVRSLFIMDTEFFDYLLYQHAFGCRMLIGTEY